MTGPFCKAPKLCKAPSAAFAHARFPDSAEGGTLARGRSKRGSAMICKIITFEFVVPTAMAAVLAITLSIVAVYLTDKYLGPIEQAEAHYSVGTSN